MLMGDMLYENGVQLTANPGSAYEALLPIDYGGNITGGFALSSSGILSWSDPAFSGGQASFCLTSDGIVLAVFIQGTQPSDCTAVTLSTQLGMPHDDPDGMMIKLTTTGTSCSGFDPIYPSQSNLPGRASRMLIQRSR